LNLEQNSDDFVFDNQMLIQMIWHGYAIGEVTCPTDYNEEASSIAKGWISAVISRATTAVSLSINARGAEGEARVPILEGI
jgi:hypothetical protein